MILSPIANLFVVETEEEEEGREELEEEDEKLEEDRGTEEELEDWTEEEEEEGEVPTVVAERMRWPYFTVVPGLRPVVSLQLKKPSLSAPLSSSFCWRSKPMVILAEGVMFRSDHGMANSAV